MRFVRFFEGRPGRFLRHVTSAVSCLVLVAMLAVATFAGDPAPAGRTSAKEQQEGFEENWQVVYIGGSRVGHGRSSVARKQRDGRDIVVSDTEMVIALSRFGQTVKMKTLNQSEETPDGDLLEFRFEIHNPPAATTRTLGRVTEDRLILETETAGKRTVKELPWDKSVKAPSYQDRLLRDSPLKPHEKRTLKVFEPQFGKPTTVTLEAGDFETVKLLEGKQQKLLKVTLKQSIVPGVVMHEFINEQGETLKTSTSLMQMATYRVSKEEALKELSGEEVDLAVATLVKPNKEIPRSQQTRRVVYRITTPGESPEKILSAGPTQELKLVGPDVVDLTVRAIAPSAEKSSGGDSPGKKFLAPNPHLQSDDEVVRKHANEAAGDATDHWTVAKKMERWVFEKIKKKNFSTLLASAAEVARDLSGDCTEHACLLAAMTRAKEIPSRVVVGIVYVPGLASFGGHMWTEVFINGEWIPLDATLGQGGIAADHIKFADSSFSDDEDTAPLASFLPLVTVLGKMKIEVQEVEHTK